MGVWYATREDVKSALDVMETARSNSQVDGAIEAASRAVESLTLRRFYPWTGTRYLDWPNRSDAPGYRLYLDENELISLETLVSGGDTILVADYNLEPYNDGPPYDTIELKTNSGASFSVANTGSSQRSIALTGVFGYSAVELYGGTVQEALDASETAVDVSDSAAVGVGNIIRVDSERMIVTGKTMRTLDQVLTVNLTALNSADQVFVSGTGFVVNETIMIDSEKMLVIDVATGYIVVKRAWDGSVLAAHTAGATIYAPRTLTVQRGTLGTTAATHIDAAPVYVHQVPGLVRELTVAEALNILLQRQSGYAREVGSGDNAREATGRGIKDLRAETRERYGRQMRKLAV